MAPGYFDLGEIFHGNATEHDVNFWGFLSEKAKVDPTVIYPGSWPKAWDASLQYQQERLGVGHFVIDLEIDFLNSTLVSNPDGTWFFFRTDNVKFISIERKNLVAQIISRLTAEATGDWIRRSTDEQQVARHDQSFEMRKGAITPQNAEPLPTDGVPRQDGPMGTTPLFNVDPEFLEAELARIEKSSRWALDIVQPYGPLRLAYEDLFDEEGGFDSRALQRIAQATGTDARHLARRPVTLKQAPRDFLDVVANRHELVAHFRGTQYGWMFRPR